MRTTVNFGVGTLHYDQWDAVVVGDRLLPRAMRALFPSDGDQPSVELKLAVVDGVPQCRQLTVESLEGGREVRTTDLRLVPSEDWVEQLFALAAHPVRGGAVKRSVPTRTKKEWQAGASVVRVARSARRRLSRDFLMNVARVHSENIDDRPVEAVRQIYGVAYRTAAMYVQRARAAEMLPRTTRGRKQA
jgi:hypothetical protein